MHSENIARLLPGVFQRTLLTDLHSAQSPLAALLTLMEALHQPPEAILAGLERYFDAYSAPEVWVYYLAGWLDLDPLFVESSLRTDYRFAPGIGHLRTLLLAAIDLANERGTYRGLRRFLQIAIGVEEFDVREDRSQPFHIQVCYPHAAAVYLPLIRRIVQMEKPAYVTYDLIEVADAAEPDSPALPDKSVPEQPNEAPAADAAVAPPVQEGRQPERATQRGQDE